MKIYVAGKTEDIPKVRTVQGLVRHTGHYLTYDWTIDVERYGVGMPLNPEVRTECAVRDVVGIEKADLLIALGHPRLNGTLWECGMAVALSLPIWLVDWHLCSGHSIFETLPNVSMRTIQEVGEALWHFSEERLEREANPQIVMPPQDG